MRTQRLRRAVFGAILTMPFCAAPPRAAAAAGQPGSFLRQDAGARALSLGGAFSALADDVSALYWNPAGLAEMDKPQLTGTHVQLFEDAIYDWGAAGLPIGPWGAVGAGFARQSSGGFERRATPFDAPTEFSVTQSAWLLGWAARPPVRYTLGRPVGVGWVFKSVAESIDTASAFGWGADVGVRLSPRKGLQLGLSVSNAIQPRLTFISEPVRYARTLRAGAAYELPLISRLRAVPVVELTRISRENTEMSGGVELQYRKRGALRFGSKGEAFSTGVGLRLGNVQWDYGVRLQELGLNHQISLSVRFGRTKEELEELIRQGIQEFNRDEASRLARAYIEQAELYWKEQNYTRALRQLEIASLWAPDDRRLQARITEIKSRIDEAFTRQILERTILLAEQEMERGNLLAGQTYWNSVLELDPRNPRARDAVQRIQNAFSRQEKQAADRLRDERTRQETARVLGACSLLLEQERFRKALEEAERSRALMVDPRQIDAFVAKAKERLARWVEQRLAESARWAETGQHAKAVEALESVLGQDPGNAEASNRLVQLRQKANSPIDAETRKKLDQQYYLAVDAYLQGKYGHSADLVRQILEQDPLNEGGRKLKDKLSEAMKLAP